MQALGGHKSDKLTLSPLFSLLQLGPAADVLDETPIVVPALSSPLLQNQRLDLDEQCMCYSIKQYFATELLQ